MYEFHSALIVFSKKGAESCFSFDVMQGMKLTFLKNLHELDDGVMKYERGKHPKKRLDQINPISQ
jgi:hypothetical protein